MLMLEFDNNQTFCEYEWRSSERANNTNLSQEIYFALALKTHTNSIYSLHFLLFFYFSFVQIHNQVRERERENITQKRIWYDLYTLVYQKHWLYNPIKFFSTRIVVYTCFIVCLCCVCVNVFVCVCMYYILFITFDVFELVLFSIFFCFSFLVCVLKKNHHHLVLASININKYNFLLLLLLLRMFMKIKHMLNSCLKIQTKTNSWMNEWCRFCKIWRWKFCFEFILYTLLLEITYT